MRIVVVSAFLAMGLSCDALSEGPPPLPVLDDPCDTWASGLYSLPLSGGRHPLVYVPEGLDKGPRDVLMMLHGAGGSAYKMTSITDLTAVADRTGSLAVFPRGSGLPGALSWNAGTCCGLPSELGTDDVAYLDRVAVALRERTCPQRLLAVGHSNGAMMTVRWACEGTERADAYVTSAAALLIDECKNTDLALLDLHGTADTVVPYEGGLSDQDFNFPSKASQLEVLRAANGCEDVAGVEEIVGDTTCTTWDCDVPLRHCAIEGWTHKWPGGPGGRQTDGLDIEPEALSWLDRVAPLVTSP